MVVNEIIELVENNSCYIFCVIIGILFRYGFLGHVYMNLESKVKQICRDILIVVLISHIWNILGENNRNDTVKVVSLIVIMIYIFYGMTSKKDENNGIMIVIKGYMVVVLSFLSFPYSVLWAIITIVFDVLVYKYFEVEAKSDFLEVVFLCLECVLISVYIWLYGNETFLYTIKTVMFLESFVFMVNCLAKSVIIKICGGSAIEYLEDLKMINCY